MLLVLQITILIIQIMLFVASMNYTTVSDTLNIGHTETFPVHTSIQYFIKF